MSEAWRPSASLACLQARAHLLRTIREFFWQRGVLEVETPLLSHYSVTDPHIQSIRVSLEQSMHSRTAYLQTSPEYAMKRLLAAGSGSIFQISKAFRQDECGRFHNPEFSLLEWYRIDFDHHALMNEIDDLLRLILACEPAERLSYQALFQRYLFLNPHEISDEALHQLARDKNCVPVHGEYSRDDILQLLLTHCIEPVFASERPVFIYDFPASQAALSEIRSGYPALASRFEVYYRGMELANGFHELRDRDQQVQRFIKNQEDRKRLQLPAMDIDLFFIDALAHGLPACAGVALGIDRLLMLQQNSSHIRDVLSFDFERV